MIRNRDWRNGYSADSPISFVLEEMWFMTGTVLSEIEEDFRTMILERPLFFKSNYLKETLK